MCERERERERECVNELVDMHTRGMWCVGMYMYSLWLHA